MVAVILHLIDARKYVADLFFSSVLIHCINSTIIFIVVHNHMRFLLLIDVYSSIGMHGGK